MQELIMQLRRLYLPHGTAPETLAQRFTGQASAPLDLADGGATRVLAIPFARQPDDGESGHWQRLCDFANTLQGELGWPAPAVSIDGASGYRVWLSFAQALPLAQVQGLLDALCAAYPAQLPALARADAPLQLPPCLHPASGKWAAFIHPGMGASFADEPGLEMAPPLGAQAAFLEGLQSISTAQLEHALGVLRPAPAAPRASVGGVPAGVPPDLLLKDATLEDIVRFLHAKHIEPTFRHLLPPAVH